MTDENKNTSQDEEYQFPQDEYTSSTEEKSESGVDAPDDAAHTTKKSVLDMILEKIRHIELVKNKRVLIVIGIVVVVFIAFHFMNNTTQKPSAPAPTVVAQPTTVAPPVEQPDNLEANALNTDQARTESKIRDLQSQLSAMQNNLLETQTENQALQKSIATLTLQVQGLTARLDAALIKPSAQGKRIVYHLRAILPDRAWITASTGETKTVTLGDYIKQYGSVQQIDAQQGVVLTSSGRKIVYGPNDY